MRLELPRLLRQSGATVLYVTQDYKEAMALADRIAVLADGRFVQTATPEDIYMQPATLGVARLFGDPSINTADTTDRDRWRGRACDAGRRAACRSPRPTGIHAGPRGDLRRAGRKPSRSAASTGLRRRSSP